MPFNGLCRMPCCTLIALLLSQPALAFGAIRARLFGAGACATDGAFGRRLGAAAFLIGAETAIFAIGLRLVDPPSRAENLSAALAHICRLGP